MKTAILKIEPINFSIKNKDEKDIIISTFQKFLNSLDFPIQMVIATDTLNLDIYMAQLSQRVFAVSQKTGNDYNKLLEDFKKHLQKIISSDGLLNRSFYIVIPEKEDLNIQVSVCQELIKNMNLRYHRLNDEELKYMLSSFFHDLYQEDNRECPDLLSAIAPTEIINTPTELKIDGVFTRTIAVKGYPRAVEEGFLDKIITLNGRFDIAIYIEPYSIDTMMVMLNKELQKQRGDLWSMEQKSIINPSLEIKYQDTRKVLENLQKGMEKLFNVSLYITCKGKSLGEINVLTKKMESELNALLMVPIRPRYEQHTALKSVLPLGRNELGIKQNITTKGLSAFFPFTSQFLQVDDTGILLGLNKNGIPIIKDIFKLYNANGVVLASSGGGKSYFTKLMIARLLLNGTKVMVIDPQAEYTDLVGMFQGQLITISRTSETIINPLDLMGHEYDEKKLTLLELFPIMLGQTSEIQRAVLDRALTTVYGQKGITNDKSTWQNEPPIMADLLQQLVAMSQHATQVEKETYRSLINRIEMYVTGVFSFVNKQTNLNFSNRFVCFNIGDMPNQVKPAIMFLILDYVYMKMKKDIERKMLVVDEAWSLLQRTEDEGYIFKIVKTCRKFNLALLLITQDVGDLLKNDAGKALLNNSEYTLLLRQKPSIIEQVEKTFQLSMSERERLLTAQTGEGILIISNEHTEIKIIASPEEHNVITTNADERLKKEIAKANDVVTEFKKTVDYAKGYFKASSLTTEEVDDLLKHEYHLSGHIGLFGGKMQDYVLKPRYNESAEHFFVIKAIEEYVKKYVDKVVLEVSSNADIIFEIDGVKFAIEVETGSQHSSKVENKVQLLKKRFGENWFFVVTDWKDKEKYAKYNSKTYVRKEVPAVIQSLVSKFRVIGSITSNKASIEVQNKCLLSHELESSLKQNTEVPEKSEISGTPNKLEGNDNGKQNRIREQAHSGNTVEHEQG